MLWADIRKTYPKQWLVIEALKARTNTESQRKLEKISVIETCENGNIAMKRYRALHQEYPQREFYFVHTSRENLDIKERQWVGIRRNHAVAV